MIVQQVPIYQEDNVYHVLLIAQLAQMDNLVLLVRRDFYYKETSAKLIVFKAILLTQKLIFVSHVRYPVKVAKLLPMLIQYM